MSTAPAPAHPRPPHVPAPGLSPDALASPEPDLRPDPGDVVHVWSAVLDRPSDPAADLALLDPDERSRAGRFRFERDRGRYVARHAFYRRVLASRLGITPATVVIRTTAEGRPALVTTDALDFNTSHADGLAVIALSHGRRVGVDVERMRHIEDAQALAEAHLTDRELDAFRALPSGSRSRAILAVWTRKEAVVKATGHGLSVPLDGFDTGPIDGPAVRQVSLPSRGRSLAVAPLEGLPDHVGSVALEGRRIEVRHHMAWDVTA